MVKDLYLFEADCARKSLARACRNQQFYLWFAERFLENPQVRHHFVNAKSQQVLEHLEHGLDWILRYAEGAPSAEEVMERMRQFHESPRLKMGPEMFLVWQKALLDTLASQDPEWTAQIEQAWREVTGLGIRYLAGEVPPKKAHPGRLIQEEEEKTAYTKKSG